MESLPVEVERGVAQIRMDRPPVNALSTALVSALDESLDSLNERQDVGAVVLCGSNGVFSAGVDVREVQSMDPPQAVPWIAWFQSVFLRLERGPIPIVAAVDGYALGGGCELMMACDIRVASEDAFLALPEIKLGSVPGIGGMQRLTRLVGMGRAKRMILTGDRISATDAHRIGLIDELAPSGAAESVALSLAERIASRPVLAVRAAKKAINIGADLPFERAQEADLRFTGELARTDDRAECLAAFLERRPPRLQRR
jgi:enoyl-CoA hydratase/carnithine racemase